MSEARRRSRAARLYDNDTGEAVTKRRDTLTNEQAKLWRRREIWDLHDAALLFIGIDPHTERGARLRKALRDEYMGGSSLSDEERDRLAEAAEIIKLAYIADHNHKLTVSTFWRGSVSYGGVEARAFLIWARDKLERNPPKTLVPIIADVKSRDDLEQEVSRLEDELQRATKFDDGGTHYPYELDIAAQAWRAVHNGYVDGGGTVSKRLKSWIEKNYSVDIASEKLKPETIARIVTVANWDKSPGKKSGPRK